MVLTCPMAPTWRPHSLSGEKEKEKNEIWRSDEWDDATLTLVCVRNKNIRPFGIEEKSSEKKKRNWLFSLFWIRWMRRIQHGVYHHLMFYYYFAFCSWFKRWPTTGKAVRASCRPSPFSCWRVAPLLASLHRSRRRATRWWSSRTSCRHSSTASSHCRSSITGTAARAARLLARRRPPKLKRTNNFIIGPAQDK